MTIGYLGIPGSYSEMTAQDYIKRMEPSASTTIECIGYSEFKHIINALKSKEIDYGVLPAENSTTGLISSAIELLRDEAVTITDDAYQPVSHTLWGMSGATIENLTHVYSHPEALSQCDIFFSEQPHITTVDYASTAQAAQYIKDTGNKQLGAIASKRAGELVGLTPLQHDIQTEKNNATRFYILKRSNEHKNTGTRLVMFIQTRHIPGALSHVLQVFSILNCNLQLLTALPVIDRAFAYGFLLEVDIDHIVDKLDLLYAMMDQVSLNYQVLGQFYPTHYGHSQKEDKR